MQYVKFLKLLMIVLHLFFNSWMKKI